ncbi:MAG: HD domain-containing protein [Spirochaetales bacterium]|nr:HD domain-containing protein [Spirochaetales bacterium]
MDQITLKQLAIPLIKSIDSFNYLLKDHHRRVAIISYHIGSKLGLSEIEMVELLIAASIHDIGALSVNERDMLIEVDVKNPEPHCILGYKMLSSVDILNNIANIIRYHHVDYVADNLKNRNIPIQSYIIHLADRVDLSISPDPFILNIKDSVINTISNKTVTLFHPKVYDAFLQIAKPDIFWIEINKLSMEDLFNRVNFNLYSELEFDQLVNFAMIFSRIIDFRSSFTASHSYTVGNLSYDIGKILNFNEEKCVKLKIAGFLHDIGKIGIDTSYLEKKTELTHDEFNRVKLHVYFTGEILNELSKSKWFQEIVLWAKNHHERKDGIGYPYCIEDSNFTIEMKIIAFADVISALMEDRPYRNGLKLDKALEIIETEIAPDIDKDLFLSISKNRDTLNRRIIECFKESKEIYYKSV